MKDFYYDRDPLRLELLPHRALERSTELTYRTRAHRGASFNHPFPFYMLANVSFFSWVLILALRILVVHFAGLSPHALSAQMLLFVFGFVLYLALPRMLSDHIPLRWILIASIPILLWIAFISATFPTWALFLLLLVTCVFLADGLKSNYMAWLLADTSTSATLRRYVRSGFSERFSPTAWTRAGLALLGENDEPRIGDSYLPGLILLVVATVLSTVLAYQYSTPAAGLIGALFLVTWLLVQGLLLGPVIGYGPVSQIRRFRVTAKAISNWLSYNPRHRVAPGLHQSPFGRANQRVTAMGGALVLLSLALTLICNYYPVLMLGPEREAPWTRQIASRLDRQPYNPSRDASFPGTSPIDWLVPTEVLNRVWLKTPATEWDFERLYATLTPPQKIYYRELGSAEARRGYLLRLAEGRRSLKPNQVAPGPRDLQLLKGTRETWLLANYLGLWGGDSIYIYSLILSLVLGITIPPLFLFLCVWALISADLAMVECRLTNPEWGAMVVDEDLEPHETQYNQEWLGHVKCLEQTANPVERGHLFLGYALDVEHDDDEVPVIFNRKLLSGHMHITGATGSGKSSRGLAAIASQLLRRASNSSEKRDKCSLLIIDLKGDDALFAGIRQDAGTLLFRWYRDEQGRSTYGYNPVAQRHMNRLDSLKKARGLIDAFGIRFDETQGQKYFADMQETTLINLFEKRQDLRSFADMHAVLRKKDAREVICPDMPEKSWEDGFHVRAEIGNLAKCRPLNGDVEAAPDRWLDVSSLFTTPQVMYLYVPALVGGGMNESVAKHALYSLLTAAGFIDKRERIPVYCIIDEFQEIAGANLRVIMRQARSFGVGLILANQVPSDLRKGSVDLEPTVSGNVAVTWSFRDVDIAQKKEVVEQSGEYLETLRSLTESENYNELGELYSTAKSVTYQQHYRPGININRVMYANFVDNLSIVKFNRGSRLTQFFRPTVVRTMFHINQELYKARENAPWPSLPWGDSPGGQPTVEPEEEPKDTGKKQLDAEELRKHLRSRKKK